MGIPIPSATFAPALRSSLSLEALAIEAVALGAAVTELAFVVGPESSW